MLPEPGGRCWGLWTLSQGPAPCHFPSRETSPGDAAKGNERSPCEHQSGDHGRQPARCQHWCQGQERGGHDFRAQPSEQCHLAWHVLDQAGLLREARAGALGGGGMSRVCDPTPHLHPTPWTGDCLAGQSLRATGQFLPRPEHLLCPRHRLSGANSVLLGLPVRGRRRGWTCPQESWLGGVAQPGWVEGPAES